MVRFHLGHGYRLPPEVEKAPCIRAKQLASITGGNYIYGPSSRAGG